MTDNQKLLGNRIKGSVSGSVVPKAVMKVRDI